MRHVAIGTANSLFKKGKETTTTKRRSQEELRIAEGICQVTGMEGPGKSSEFLLEMC